MSVADILFFVFGFFFFFPFFCVKFFFIFICFFIIFFWWYEDTYGFLAVRASPLLTTSTPLLAILGLVLRERTPPQTSNAYAEQRYTEHADKNAKKGAGAVEIDVSAVTSLTVAQCKQRCTDDPKCECVTFHDTSKSSCFKRKQCDPSKFAVARKEGGGSFYVFMKLAKPVTTTTKPVKTTRKPVTTTRKPVKTTKPSGTTKQGVYILEDFVRLHAHSDYCFPRL